MNRWHYPTLLDVMRAEGTFPFVGPPKPDPPPPTSLAEKWQRLSSPQCVADYGLSMPLSEIAQVPEAMDAVLRYLPTQYQTIFDKENRQ